MERKNLGREKRFDCSAEGHVEICIDLCATVLVTYREREKEEGIKKLAAYMSVSSLSFFYIRGYFLIVFHIESSRDTFVLTRT